MNQSGPKYTRREPRFAIREGRNVEARFEHGRDDSDRVVQGELIDLSSTGVKIVTDHPLPIRDEITLCLQVDEVGLNLELTATVCWARPMGKGRWWIGCALADHISHEKLDELALSSFLERRKDVRREISLNAQGRMELAAEAVPVKLLDYSHGGFRVFTTQKTTPGARLLLQFDGEAAEAQLIPAKVCWQHETENGFEIGCAFTQSQGYQQLHCHIESVDPLWAESRRKSGRGHRGWRWLALAALFATAAAVVALYLQHFT